MINKYALAFAAFCVTTGASAQWITLTDHDGIDVTNGSTNKFQITSAGATLVIHLEAVINGGADRTVNVKRYEMGVAPTTQNYFCWNLCYLPQNAGAIPVWVAGDYQNMDPGVPFTGFAGYHVHNGDYSLSTYRYVWYDVANPNDSAYVDLVFESAVGLADVAAVQQFSVTPNPANDATTVTYASSGGSADAVVVYNALGAQVFSTAVAATQRNAQLNLASLREGLYFVSLRQRGRTLGTQRLVVTR